jgi:hypothetical protein
MQLTCLPALGQPLTAHDHECVPVLELQMLHLHRHSPHQPHLLWVYCRAGI